MLSTAMQSKASDRLPFCSIVCEVYTIVQFSLKCMLQCCRMRQSTNETNEKTALLFQYSSPTKQGMRVAWNSLVADSCEMWPEKTELDSDRLLLLGVLHVAPLRVSLVLSLFRHCAVKTLAMLETTMVHVAPMALHHGRRVDASSISRRTSTSTSCGGSGSINSRADFWVLRVAIALLASSTFAASSPTGEEVAVETTSTSGDWKSAEDSSSSSSIGIVVQMLASGKGNPAALSMLKSLLASLDALLSEIGLPSASMVCAALAVAILAFAFVRKVAIGGGGVGSRALAKKRKGVVLFLGPCGAGKSAVCYRLCHNQVAPTVTSMQACKYDGSRLIEGRGSSPVSLVDYPGHERLRGRVGEELRAADRVVFVLDGSCLVAQIAAGAELLYDVLTDPSLEGCRGLMFALNKSDIKEAKVSRAKTLLQKELEKLRGTRGTLGTQGEDDMPVATALGRPGQPFILEVDSPCEVVVAACSVVVEGGLDPVVDFVRASVR